MDSTGACKAISANCKKAAYANAAHDNIATTACDCTIANCATCSSKTACSACAQRAWAANADYTWRKDTTCADKVVYCANGAKVACDGTCTAATGSNCGSLIYHSACTKYELKTPGSEYANYKGIDYTAKLTTSAWHCTACTTATHYVGSGTC